MYSPQRVPGGFPIVGIIGGGQLARMCQPPAINLSITLDVLIERSDAAAAQVIPATSVGSHLNQERVLAFARDCDIVTFDHEHVPQEILHALVDAGVVVHPKPEALIYAQDKLAMRRRLTQLQVPCPEWAAVSDCAELTVFGDRHGWPVVLKTPRGGYDGKNVRVIHDAVEANDWFARGEVLLAETSVPFTRELAVLVARSPSGQAAVWPIVHTVQTDGICTEVLAPAPDLEPGLQSAVTHTALSIVGELDVTGVFALELFEIANPESGGSSYVVNEFAMRPHNSGHWTMDGSVTSQFEQHLRAVLDLPFGDVRPRARWSVMANVLGGDYPELYPAYKHLLARDPGLKVHFYGKGMWPGRKIGHVNVYGDDLQALRERARYAVDYFEGTITE